MTPQEKVTRGEAPVKEEFVRRVARVRVDTVTGSLGVVADADGAQLAAKKKSRNQLRKERNQQRFSKSELCTMLVQGNCKFGNSCRFNHDIAAYLKSKPADLPGICPFDSTGTCPFGITCRWAGKHRHADLQSQQALHAEQQQVQQTQQQQEQELEKDEAPAPMAADGAPGASKEEAVGDAPLEHTAEGDALAGEGELQQAQQVDTCHPTEQNGEAEQAKQDWWWRGDGTIPGRVVGLISPGGKVEESVNVLDKGLQAVLRKEQYDFGQADAVLQSLGIHNSRQRQRQEQRQQRRGQRDAQQEAQQDSERANGAVKKAVEGAEGASANSSAAKRARLDTSTASLNSADIAASTVVALAEAPAANSAVTPGASAAAEGVASSDAAFLAGLGDEGGKKEQGDLSVQESTPGLVATGEERGGRGGDYMETQTHPREKRSVDFRDKLYLAPLTTVGNLPFRRLCKGLGADITCGEMALATNLLQGQASEWALLKRHPSEDCFGVQVCGGYPDSMARCAELIEENCQVDFVDVNFGCPIDVVCSKGGGSACLLKPQRMEQIVRSMSALLSCPLTFKCRKGYHDNQDMAHTIIPRAKEWGAAAVTIHGRTREQRYSRLADWDYIHRCAELAPAGLQVVGNGDCFSYEDYYRCLKGGPGGRKLAAMYIARGALIKPWIFTEIKERRHWDISAGERLDMLRQFCGMGLEHWGSDNRGVETTRRFLLEWLSFTYRYIPVGLLEALPQQLHWRPPAFVGRNDLETLLASDNAADWVKISEMLLGPAPPGFVFAPKHKANSYAKREGADVAISMDEY